MLTDARVYATIPVRDFERAKRFYRDTLGLKPGKEAAGGVNFVSGGTQLFLFTSSTEEQPRNTLASWEVADLDAEMADLRSRGITFEEYDLPGLKTVNGVAEMDGARGAWFRDSEGNVLALTQMG